MFSDSNYLQKFTITSPHPFPPTIILCCEMPWSFYVQAYQMHAYEHMAGQSRGGFATQIIFYKVGFRVYCLFESLKRINYLQFLVNKVFKLLIKLINISDGRGRERQQLDFQGCQYDFQKHREGCLSTQPFSNTVLRRKL